MTDATEPAAGRRRLSARQWLLVALLGLVGLLGILIGVALLTEPGDECGCSPVPPPPTASSSA